ncbi:hypothetical protein CPB83DRAFT_888356 [Crepidotus variabilis]|uniref:Uncharacterized protein n=1 Tax=Crepidotus variabilis TaxID=179855 RepID=A0A9P6EUS6_9AGAR|nr:hypothetical protein CPB83DRAFT_888356 [Crepidotus variabilis]
MTDKQARTLTQPSNRAKFKDTREKKTVFKPVLDSPFRIQWPSLPLNSQNRVLAHILELLAGAAEYQQKRFSASRKRKQLEKDHQPTKKAKTDGIDPVEQQLASNELTISIAPPNTRETTIAAPFIFQHLVCGINAVTKRLEAQTHAARRPVITTGITHEPQMTCKPLKYVLVCRADIDPPMLIDHLPHLVAAFNSTRPQNFTKLVPLPKGSEASLAEALGIRRVAVVGLEEDPPDDQTFKEMMDKIPTLAAAWLTQVGPQELIPTHVKQTHTTAPKDMNVAKEMRIVGRGQAKKRKHQKKKNKDGDPVLKK